MKKVYVPEKFDLVDIVNKLKGKIKVKDFLKRRLPECVGIIIGISISAFLFSSLNIISLLCIGTFTGFVLLSERYRNREIAKKSIDNSMCLESYDEVLEDLELKDFSNAITCSKKPKNEHWWLVDGMGRVDNKKVVSYIAMPKKYRLIVFKQILNEYKYESDKLEDTSYTQMFLLDDNDLIKERIVTNDGYLNERNMLGKKLINSKFYK